jgi:hypothetical protein
LEDTGSIEKGEGETERRIDKKVKNEDTREVRTPIDRDDVTHHQPPPFDWTTDVEQLTSSVPVLFTNSTPAEHVDMSNKPAYITSDNSTPTLGADTVADTTPTDPVSAAITQANPALAEPIRTAVTVSINTSNNPVIYPPRDFSGLRSGARNPWGSISHRRHRFHPVRDHLFSPAE